MCSCDRPMRRQFTTMRQCVSAVRPLACVRGVLLVLCMEVAFSEAIRIKRELLGDNVQSYLMQFGYMEHRDDVASAFRTEESIRDAIKEMQKFAGLPASGVLDAATEKLLRTPRCGRPDKERGQTSGRRKRFVAHGSPWPKTNLTWSLKSWDRLNKADVIKVLGKALQVWSKHSKLEFRNVDETRTADINIQFYRLDHGDRFPFDGKGIVLAHAFFPSSSGSPIDVHFDADESWIMQGQTEPGSTNLFNVAAHEFGHSLGLGHSSVENALMYPWYKEMVDGFDYELPEDDRNGIQQLYGRRETGQIWDNIPVYRPPPPRPPTTTTTPRPHTPSTRRPHIPYNPYHGHQNPPYNPRTEKNYYPNKPMNPDKKHYNKNNGYPDPRYYPTKDPKHHHHHHHHQNHNPHHHIPERRPTETPHRIPERHHPKKIYPGTGIDGVRPGNPERPTTRVSSRNHPVKESKPPPDTCDTSYDAVATIRREVFIFKDAYLWRIGEHGLLPGYPALIHRLWNSIPKDLDHVDAVYERHDGKIVFFIGRLYYVFTGQRLEPNFPRPITDLGLPQDLEKIDGAMVWGHNGHTYFYSGDKYWRFDEKEQRVELDYPRKMGMWKGVGTDIDAVFQWRDGKTYFFKDKGYWKFNDMYMRVEHSEPKPSAPFWMGCSDNFESNDIGQKLPYKDLSSGNAKTSTSLAAFMIVFTLVFSVF